MINKLLQTNFGVGKEYTISELILGKVLASKEIEAYNLI